MYRILETLEIFLISLYMKKFLAVLFGIFSGKVFLVNVYIYMSYWSKVTTIVVKTTPAIQVSYVSKNSQHVRCFRTRKLSNYWLLYPKINFFSLSKANISLKNSAKKYLNVLERTFKDYCVSNEYFTFWASIIYFENHTKFCMVCRISNRALECQRLELQKYQIVSTWAKSINNILCNYVVILCLISMYQIKKTWFFFFAYVLGKPFYCTFFFHITKTSM